MHTNRREFIATTLTGGLAVALAVALPGSAIGKNFRACRRVEGWNG